jgi:flagellar FliJ protein
MEPVQRVAEKRENAAAKCMGESRQKLSDQEARLKELQDYRDQYAAQFSTRGLAGLDALQLHDYRIFLSRLNQAIQQQELVIGQCRNQHHQNQDQWHDMHRHTKVVDKLIERFKADEQQQQQKREQQVLDDHAQRMFHASQKEK